MSYQTQENFWMLCLNCDYTFTVEEWFTGTDSVVCPLCDSMSCRETTATDEHYDIFDEYYTYIENDSYD